MKRIPARGAWTVLAVLGLLVAIVVPELGSDPWPFHPPSIKPHDVLPHGVSNFLPAIGMTNAEALVATTSVAAGVCGIADVAGTLEAGKDADVIAVAGNPLVDIAAIHDVVAIYARGRDALPG